jgi:hypothetical protein
MFVQRLRCRVGQSESRYDAMDVLVFDGLEQRGIERLPSPFLV